VWLALASRDLQLVPLCGWSSLELEGHKLGMLLLENASHVEELIYFIDPVQGLNIQILLEKEISTFILYSLGLG